MSSLNHCDVFGFRLGQNFTYIRMFLRGSSINFYLINKGIANTFTFQTLFRVADRTQTLSKIIVSLKYVKKLLHNTGARNITDVPSCSVFRRLGVKIMKIATNKKKKKGFHVA